MSEDTKKIIADWHQKMEAIRNEKRKGRDERKVIIFEYHQELSDIIEYMISKYNDGERFFSYKELMYVISKKHDFHGRKLWNYTTKVMKALNKTGAAEFGLIVNENIKIIKLYERPVIKRPVSIKKSSKGLWSQHDKNLIMRERKCEKCGAMLDTSENILCLICEQTKEADEERESKEDKDRAKKKEENKW